MQIENVKISNLLSFAYNPNLKSDLGINFSTSTKSRVDILIWPNWSGKTSFLEILNQILKVWLSRDYVYNKHLFLWSSNLTKKNVITENRLFLKNLQKNFTSLHKWSRVILLVKVSYNDFDNLRFLCKFGDKVNEIIKKYSRLKVQFCCMDFQQLVEYKFLNLSFVVDVEKWTVKLNKRNMSHEERFILNYLINQELVQIAMNIYNDFEKKPSDRVWYPLKNTFAILWSHRDFWDMVEIWSKVNHVSPQQMSLYISGQNTKTYYSISIWYHLCIIKLWDVVRKIKSDFEFSKESFVDLYNEYYRGAIKKSSFYIELNFWIKKYIWMVLEIDYVDGNFVFLLEDSYWYKYNFIQLSSGVKSFFMIIMTIYGYDLESWLLIIDEPELHLHPQMQNSFTEFINEISEKLNLQVILATHSPLMVNEDNIFNVYRFTKKWTGTEIINPSLEISADESDLVHMLKFENVSKIFFVNKIILVEWETDVYFFDYYLNFLKSLPDWKDKIWDYEILNINWKWSYRRRNNFLSKFGIDSYFIWDWDNIVDQHIISDQEMQYYNQKSHKYYRFLKSTKWYVSKSRYWVLVEMINNYYPNDYHYIIEQIESLYLKNIFIFKNWDLETYLSLKIKWLDEVISFCQNDFQKWYHSSKYLEYRKELDNFFEIVFRKLI